MESRTIEPCAPSFPLELQAGSASSKAGMRIRKQCFRNCIGPELYRVSRFAVYAVTNPGCRAVQDQSCPNSFSPDPWNQVLAQVSGIARCRSQPCCPPESGGQHDRDSSRDRAGGGSRAVLSKNAFRNITFGEPPLASSQRTR